MGQSTSKKHKGRQALRPAIENADRLTVDSACLHCPVCLEVFSVAPIIFECGHSVCPSCTRRIVASSMIYIENQKYFECPLCRKELSRASKLITNYTIEAILDSVSEMAEDSTVAGSDNNARFENQRLKVRLVDSEREKHVALARAEGAELQIYYYRMAVASLLVIMFYGTIIGKIFTSS